MGVTRETYDEDYQRLLKAIAEKGQVFFGSSVQEPPCGVEHGHANPRVHILYALERAGYVKVDWNPVIDLAPEGSWDCPTFYALRVEVVRELP